MNDDKNNISQYFTFFKSILTKNGEKTIFLEIREFNHFFSGNPEACC